MRRARRSDAARQPEADVSAAADDASFARQRSDHRRPVERDVEVQRRRELAGLEHRGQRRSHRVVEHRGEEATLDVAGGIGELGLAVEAQFGGAGFAIDLREARAQRVGRARRRQLARHDAPEERLTIDHGRGSFEDGRL
jgi:hypothetical protein